MTTQQELPASAVPDAIRSFLGDMIYASDAQLDALTMALAITHAVDSFTTVPRILVTSDDPESGKTTVLDAARMLAFNAWMADATSYALRAKYQEPERVTVIVDEISKIFGESGLNGRTNPIYKLLAEGYRNTATLSLSVNRTAVDVSSFGVAFLAGLRTAVPSDIRSRSITIKMKPAPTSAKLIDALNPSTETEGKELRASLHAWAGQHKDEMRRTVLNGLRNVHPKLRARRLQIWGPLFAAAFAAGDDWPARILAAFVDMALDQSDKPVLTPAQVLLLDTADILVKTGVDRIFTADLVSELRQMEDRELYTKTSDDYLVMSLLPKALGESQTLRGTSLAGQRVKGKARMAMPILQAAQALREALYPPMEESEPDETDMEMSLEQI